MRIRSSQTKQLSFAAVDGAAAPEPPERREERNQVVRIVEYSHYPRCTRDEQRSVAFTRNESTGGMCLSATRGEHIGELLRVAVRNVDGCSTLDALARVVWCESRDDGRYWLGLALLEKSGARMLTVRPRAATNEEGTAVTA